MDGIILHYIFINLIRNFMQVLFSILQIKSLFSKQDRRCDAIPMLIVRDGWMNPPIKIHNSYSVVSI